MTQSIHVLIAEDNPINARLAVAMLTSQGCTVEVVEDGLQALQTLGSKAFDLIFMDMRMPNMDGLEATRAYRSVGGKTPVVALTANAFEEDRLACLDAGMNDFLSKPIALRDLQSLLARYTNLPGQAKVG